MNHQSLNRTGRPTTGRISLLTLLCAANSLLAQGTWNGGSATDSNWSDNSNWGGTAPASGGLFTFGGTARQTNTNNLSGLTLAGVTLSTANWNISGNPVTVSGTVTASVSGTSVWGLPTALSGGVTWSQSASGDIFNLTGNLSGTGSFYKTAGSTGQGVVYLSNLTNSFTGSVNVRSGTVYFYSLALGGANSSLGAGPSSSVIGIGSTATSYAGTLTYLGTNNGITDRGLAFQNNTTGSPTFNNNSPSNSSLTIGGAVSLSSGTSGDGFPAALAGTSTGTNTFNGAFASSGSGAFGLTITGPGTWVFNNLINLSGNLTVATNSHVVLGYTNTYPGSTVAFPTMTLNPGATLDLSAYDNNGTNFTLGAYPGFPQTLVAGRTNGASVTDINGSLNLGVAGLGGGTLNVAGIGKPGTLTISSNFIPASGTIAFDFNTNTTSGSGTNDLIVVGHNLDLSQGNALVAVNALHGTLNTNTAYTLITYSGTLLGSASGLSVPSPTRVYKPGVVSTATPGLVQVTFGPSGQTNGTLVWNGDVNQNWDVDTTLNWLNGGSSDYFFTGDNVIFDDTASQFNVNVVAAVSPGSVTFSNSANGYTLSGSGYITGGTALTLQGAGSLTLGTLNSYTGGTTINAGTLVLGANAALPRGSGVVVNGTLDLAGFNPTIGSLSGSGVVDDVSAGGTPGLIVSNTATCTFSGVLQNTSGSLSLTNSGSGTLTLSGTNTYTGGLTATAGTVNLAGNQSAATGSIVISPTSAANATTVNVAAGTPVVVAPGNKVQVGANSSNGTTGQNLDVNGMVTNNGTLWVARLGYLNLGSGGIWYQSGDMTVNPPASSGYSANMAVYTGGSFVYGGVDPIVIGPSIGNGGQGILAIDGGTFTTGQGFNTTNTPGGSTGYGQIQLSTNGTLVLAADIPQLTAFLNTNSVPAISLGSGGGAINTAGFSTTITNNIGGAGGLTILGGGSVTLGASNSYTGNTTISSGTLFLTGSASLASSNLVIAGGSTLDVTGLSTPPLVLAAGQAVSNSTPAALLNGSADATSGALGLVYAAGTPALNVGNGTLTVAATTAVNVNNTGSPLAVGSYLLVSTNAGGAVSGTAPGSVTVGGNGLAAGDVASLSITNSTLNLLVAVNPVNTNPTNITAVVSGTNFSLSWPTDHIGWRLLVQTNHLAGGVSVNTNDWSTFSGGFTGTNHVSLPINPALPQEFFRLVYP